VAAPGTRILWRLGCGHRATVAARADRVGLYPCLIATNRILVASLGVLAAGVLVVAAGSASARRTAVTPVPGCSPVQNPDGKVLVVSDLPLHGAGRAQAQQMSDAIAFELNTAGWRAGTTTIAYQSCDDSTGSTGHWDADACRRNATAYANNPAVIGIIGPSNSGCTQVELPIANRAPNGPLALVSPANTYVGLTHAGPGSAAGEPSIYYPTGKRDYARLVGADDVQAEADATLARSLGVSRLFVVNDGQAYGIGIATDVARAAKKLGVTVVRFTSYDPTASSYSTLAAQIRASGAQAVFLGGLVTENGGALIRDIRAGAPGIGLIAPAGFTPVPTVVRTSGGAAEGMYVSVAGLPTANLPAAGRAFAKAFAKTTDAEIDPASVYAAQAADVLLQAIANSNGSRSGVASALLKVHLRNGIVGDVAFDANGDPQSSPVTIYKIVNHASTVYKIVS
jgi:branched-chain amino acid transport system substrate-binding protein